MIRVIPKRNERFFVEPICTESNNITNTAISEELLTLGILETSIKIELRFQNKIINLYEVPAGFIQRLMKGKGTGEYKLNIYHKIRNGRLMKYQPEKSRNIIPKQVKDFISRKNRILRRPEVDYKIIL